MRMTLFETNCPAPPNQTLTVWANHCTFIASECRKDTRKTGAHSITGQALAAGPGHAPQRPPHRVCEPCLGRPHAVRYQHLDEPWVVCRTAATGVNSVAAPTEGGAVAAVVPGGGNPTQPPSQMRNAPLTWQNGTNTIRSLSPDSELTVFVPREQQKRQGNDS